MYRAPGSQSWAGVADNLNNADGTLSNRANFSLLSRLTPDAVNSSWLGPDSMKIDGKGNMYVAQFIGGKILKISPARETPARFQDRGRQRHDQRRDRPGWK